MISDKIQLTAKEILEQDFKTSMRGYNQEEVDQFLDTIIKDYENFQQELEALRQENNRLKRQLTEMPKRSAQQPSSQPQTATQPQAGTTNFDILKRLSNLEKHVFGSKLYD
ncbi:cell division regulator GpsB [Priestia filamentosa]|uniref:Cell cycle protein GpsB n=1 Tax=Priestia filamentosa TaxID=1402861 RepID=A0A1X7F3T0_9BACI|nr:cell division regulator GpsB [Priestia filamentosa]AKO91672.1 cell division protein DivIVA [Priestia filamentosa]MDT3761790.1 cell division regulator GpsB [Priestia filamentosa]OXS67882.1 DivIVA domain-containing protein [Priestia filamentosa]RJS64919.1 cell division regulator GpsB [Priestia filamentosa]WCM16884.1 cell division regulator GpsB [Priestia filamentosa]